MANRSFHRMLKPAPSSRLSRPVAGPLTVKGAPPSVAKVDVNVNQAWTDDQAARVDDNIRIFVAFADGQDFGRPFVGDPQFARHQFGHERLVLGQHVHLAFRAGQMDEVHVAFEDLGVRGEDFELERGHGRKT